MILWGYLVTSAYAYGKTQVWDVIFQTVSCLVSRGPRQGEAVLGMGEIAYNRVGEVIM